jgi:hypothetical protein
LSSYCANIDGGKEKRRGKENGDIEEMITACLFQVVVVIVVIIIS